MTARLLIVDDEPAILLTLRAILEINGFSVATAKSAAVAKVQLDTGVFDLVITDMRMETETAGHDVIRCAKQQNYRPATAILTAYPLLAGKNIARGAESILVKPVNTAELLAKIEELLTARERRLSAGA